MQASWMPLLVKIWPVFFRFFCAGHVGPNRSMLTSPSSTPLPLLTSLALGWEVLVRKSFHKKGTTMVARVYWWKSEIVSYSFLNHTCFTSQPDSIFTMTSPSHVLATFKHTFEFHMLQWVQMSPSWPDSWDINKVATTSLGHLQVNTVNALNRASDCKPQALFFENLMETETRGT